MTELECPICSADFPLSGEERKGDEVFCAYCSAPFRMTQDAASTECELEEDF
jgi:uncharacterized Zn-finger protein